MLRKKFNAKYANDMSFLNEMGMNIIDPDALSDIESGDEGTEDSRTRPVYVYSKDPNRVQREPNEVIMDQKSSIPKLKELTNAIRNRKSPKLDYLHEHAKNIFNIGAHYAYMDMVARNSAYACPTCGGKKNGGRKKLPASRIKEQASDVCPTCKNTGHTLTNPELNIFDIKQQAENYNTALSFHDTYCTSKRCHNRCQFKEDIDKHCRTGIPLHEIKKKDTHLRSGTTNEWLINNLRPKVVHDEYKGFSPFLRAVGGREDDPLQEGDFVHFINHDTINPGNTLKKKDEGFHRFKEEYDEQGKPTGSCAVKDCGKEKFNINHIERQKLPSDENIYVKGGRDKQSTGIIANINPDGTGDVFQYYRPIKFVQEEVNQRENGHPERAIKFHSAYDGMNLRGEDDKETRDLQHHLKNSYNEIMPLIGERSPLSSTNYGRWRIQRNVPLSRAVRLSPITAPLAATSGVTTEVVPKSKIKGVYPGGSWLPKRKKNSDGVTPPEPKTRVDIIHRQAMGCSTDELRNIPLKTNDPDTIEEFKRFSSRWDQRLGIKPGHPLSISSIEPGTAVSEQHRAPTKSIEENTAPKSFNSGSFSQLEIPTVEIPGALKMTHTPEQQNDMLNVIEGHIGRKLQPHERNQAIEGIRKDNHINGGLKAIGQKVDEDEEE